MNNSNLLNSLLCAINPKFPINNSHFVSGSNISLFTSLAQVENCLTTFTNKCKNINCCSDFRSDLKDNK